MLEKNWEARKKLELVLLSLKDLDEAFQIDQACFKKELAFPKSFVRFLLTSPDCIGFGVKDNEKLVGFIIAQAENLIRVRLITLDVREEYRRKGIGKALLEHIHNFLKEKGFIRVVLEVAVDNQPAIALYQKLGYEEKRIITRYYPDGSDAVLMEKRL